MLAWVKGLFRRSKPVKSDDRIHAKYDAAQTTDDNREHWKQADGLSARGANSLEVRKKLRERSRYATHEANSYANGICETSATDLIGTGPRLQVLTENPADNRQYETAWAAWDRAVGLPDDLTTGARAEFTDGEMFIVLGTDLGLENPVKLRPRLIECDQCTTPAMLWATSLEANAVDGIVFYPADQGGAPKEYHFLKDHPGDLAGWAQDYDTIPAKFVIHWFKKSRPGQARGVPAMTTGITPLEEMRRYALAVVAAAETAADMAVVIKTQQSPNVEPDIDKASDFDALPIRRRMMVRLPAGHELGSAPAGQPTDTFPLFKREMLLEAARCTGMPYGMVAGDSSDSSYAGGRQEVQGWQLLILVRRSFIERNVLWRIFAAWYAEALLIPGLLPESAPRDPRQLPLRWDWDRREHVDPQKEANAETSSIENRTRSRTEICASRGRDWQGQVLPQLIAEEAALKAAGLSEVPQPPAPPVAPKAKPDPTEATAQMFRDSLAEIRAASSDRFDVFASRIDRLADAMAKPAPAPAPPQQLAVTVQSLDAQQFAGLAKGMASEVVNAMPTPPAPIIQVNVPTQPVPDIFVQPAPVTVQATPPAITVTPAPVVIQPAPKPGKRTVVIKDANGDETGRAEVT